MKARAFISIGGVGAGVVCLVACSYDWGQDAVASSPDTGTDAATSIDADLQCRGASECPKSDEPSCCFATFNGKTQSKCRSTTQCLNQGGTILCQGSAECPASKPTCDLALVPSGSCQ